MPEAETLPPTITLGDFPLGFEIKGQENFARIRSWGETVVNELSSHWTVSGY